MQCDPVAIRRRRSSSPCSSHRRSRRGPSCTRGTMCPGRCSGCPVRIRSWEGHCPRGSDGHAASRPARVYRSTVYELDRGPRSTPRRPLPASRASFAVNFSPGMEGGSTITPARPLKPRRKRRPSLAVHQPGPGCDSEATRETTQATRRGILHGPEAISSLDPSSSDGRLRLVGSHGWLLPSNANRSFHSWHRFTTDHEGSAAVCCFWSTSIQRSLVDGSGHVCQ